MQKSSEKFDVATGNGNQRASGAMPLKFRKRIGSSIYEVRIHFNPDAKETMDEVIMRLIRNETRGGREAS